MRPSKIHRNFKFTRQANGRLLSKAKCGKKTQTAVLEELLLSKEVRLTPKAKSLLMRECRRSMLEPMDALESVLVRALAK